MSLKYSLGCLPVGRYLTYARSLTENELTGLTEPRGELSNGEQREP